MHVMDWQDNGIVLSARRHGETSAIVQILTRERGVHGGLVKGGFSKRTRATIEPGNVVQARWRGRLAEHLGQYQLETQHSHGAGLMESRDLLAAMTAALSMCAGALPEREPHPAMFEVLKTFLEALEHAEIAAHVEAWGSLYVKWELGLLKELGFRLDLEHCAATGVTEDLVWVSPKSGRAVSAEAGELYRDKLLALPKFLCEEGGIAESKDDVIRGLKLTGYFLDRHIFTTHDRPIPRARARLVERLVGSGS